MDNIIKLDSVDTYNKLFGLETKHPLVSVVDLSKARLGPRVLRSTMESMLYTLRILDAVTSSTAASPTTIRRVRL